MNLTKQMKLRLIMDFLTSQNTSNALVRSYFITREMIVILKSDYLVAGSAAVGATSGFWNSDHVTMFHKYRIFMAIQVNLILWVFESYDLKEPSLNRYS